MRVLVDASALIALASSGRLDLLHDLFGTVHAPAAVLAEATRPGRPGAAAIEAAVGAWIEPVEHDPTRIPGLGPGESAMLTIARDDLLVLDDRAARTEARSRGLRVTGLLGCLVHGARSGAIERDEAIRTLEALAHGPFRMSVDLYDEVRRRL